MDKTCDYCGGFVVEEWVGDDVDGMFCSEECLQYRRDDVMDDYDPDVLASFERESNY